MASYFLFNGLRPLAGRRLWVASSLGICILCGCSRGEGEEASTAEAPGDVPGAALSVSVDPGVLVEETLDMAATQRRARAAGDRLRKHRETLLAENPEMAQAWKDRLGDSDEARAAQQKVMVFFQEDAKGMELEEALRTEMKAMQKAHDTMIERAQNAQEGGPLVLPSQASTNLNPRRGTLGPGARSAGDVLEMRRK